MIPKYTIEYGTQSRKHTLVRHYSTDDPVACEEFVMALLARGARILSISHEGVALSLTDFDKMIRTAASMLASERICTCLGIKPDEEHFRFGFAA